MSIPYFRNTMKYTVLIVLSLCFLLPFVWMVSTSLKDDGILFSYPIKWLPTTWEWHFYPEAIRAFPFFVYLKNSVLISVLNVVGAILSSALIAYGFSRIEWPGRDVLFVIVISTLLIPYQVYMVPTFILFKQLGWTGTLLPLIVPAFFGAYPFCIFLLRQFFMTLPGELSLAAKIDGCNEFRVFWNIMLPLTQPALAACGLFTFVWNWNDFIGPLIYLTEGSQYTLPIGLQTFKGNFDVKWQQLMAVSTIITLPIILIYLLVQKTFIEGISMGGVKE